MMTGKARRAVEKLFLRIDTAGINLSQLSRESGITRVTLSNWKHSKALPTLEAYLEVEAAVKRLEDRARAIVNA